MLGELSQEQASAGSDHPSCGEYVGVLAAVQDIGGECSPSRTRTLSHQTEQGRVVAETSRTHLVPRYVLLVLTVEFNKNRLEQTLTALRDFLEQALREMESFEDCTWSMPCSIYLIGLSEVLSEWGGLDTFFVQEMERLGTD